MRLVKKLFDIFSIYFFLGIRKNINGIRSTTAYSDVQFLFLLARSGWGQGAIVEIGSFEGKSVVAMALGSKSARREKVVSIDPHIEGTKEAFLRNVAGAGVGDYVIPKIATSEDVSAGFDSKIRLIFIDGNHDYEFVRKDILFWKDRVIDGGVMAFHDYGHEGVRRALDELIRTSGQFIYEGMTGCMVLFSKKIAMNKELFDEMKVFNKLKEILRPWKRPKR